MCVRAEPTQRVRCLIKATLQSSIIFNYYLIKPNYDRWYGDTLSPAGQHLTHSYHVTQFVVCVASHGRAYGALSQLTDHQEWRANASPYLSCSPHIKRRSAHIVSELDGDRYD